MSSYRDLPTLLDGAPPDDVALLKQMLRVRFFEDAVSQLFAKGGVRGSSHLCQGQEAITVGVASAMHRGDTMLCTYRGHGATIAHGSALDRCFGEILGRAGGFADGRGGSMHFTDVPNGALGSNAIVGAHLPIAVGAALASSYLGTGAVTVAYFGDGASNIGAFHESMNLAAIWKLPVLFVLENNQYGEYSPIASTTPIERLADRAASYGMPGWFVDGNDVVSMRAAASEAAERARSGSGPTLIEADTYRYSGHSRNDPAAYRPEGELERWLARDPIVRLENAVLERDPSRQTELERVRAEVADEVAEARDRALAWPEPDLSSRFRDVYA